MRRLALGAAALCCLVIGLPGAWPATVTASTPSMDIASAGPLTHVFIGNDLSCQVQHAGSDAGEIYPPTVQPADCGTLIVVGDALYAPDFHARGTATHDLGAYTAYTPVSQSAVTGAGTDGSPYRVVTVADAGDSGIRITETDTYVIGQESYRTDIAVANTGSVPLTVRVYRGGDCYLGGDDEGYGLAVPSTQTVACALSPGNSPAGLVEQWSPITPADHYYEAFYRDLWSRIGAQLDLPDTCRCLDLVDNAAAIEWNRTVAASGSETLSHLTTFSTAGSLPVVVTKSADAAAASAGADDGYTITLTNPNPSPVSVTSIVDALPAGFSYVGGSSGSVTSSDPGIDGQELTWSGPFPIDGDGGSVRLHFRVTVSDETGTYYNNASTRGGADSVPTGNTAPIVVTAARTTPTATVRIKTHTPTASATAQPGTPTATPRPATATPAAIDTVLAGAATPRAPVAVLAPNTGRGAGGGSGRSAGWLLPIALTYLIAGATGIGMAVRLRALRRSK